MWAMASDCAWRRASGAPRAGLNGVARTRMVDVDDVMIRLGMNILEEVVIV